MTDFVTIQNETWFKVLTDKEKASIKNLFVFPVERWVTPAVYDEAHWAIEQFHLMHELMPFHGPRISIRSWIQKARDEGIIIPSEMGRLIHFCVYKLMF